MKVYEVIELYTCDITEAHTTIFDTFEKAKNAFDKFVEREEKETWIEGLIKSDKLNDPLNDSEIEHCKDYYHALDVDDFYETTIWIEEKEVL